MNIEYRDDQIFVDYPIGELLAMYVQRRETIRYDYLCALVRVEVERKRSRKSFATAFDRLYDRGEIFTAVHEVGANMCLEFFEIAGLSQKGQSRFRRHCREQHDYAFVMNRVVDANETHISLDDIEEVSEDERFLSNPTCTAFVQRMKDLGDGDVRMGILREVTNRKPDHVVKFVFNQ